MEAPDRIYLPEEPFKDGNSETCWNYKPIGGIEYIRTDVAIEKIEEFIYSALNSGIMGTANIEDFMKLFKKYMKGE